MNVVCVENGQRRWCVLLLGALVLVLATGMVQGREPDSPEVQALIGLRVPDEPDYRGPGWRPGSIGDVLDEWKCLDGERSGEFIVGPCYHRNGISALIAMRHSSRSPDYSIVVDAVVLPSRMIFPPVEVQEQLGWDARMRKDQRRQYAYSSCRTEQNRDGKPIVVALARPEMRKTCPHFTRRIMQAWQLNRQTRKIEPLSQKNVFCWWNACLLNEKTCENEDLCNTP